MSTCRKKTRLRGLRSVTPPRRQKNNITVAPDKNNNGSKARGDDTIAKIEYVRVDSLLMRY